MVATIINKQHSKNYFDCLPVESVHHIFDMALEKDDYWTIGEMIRICAGVRGLCKVFASVLTWDVVSRLLSVEDIRKDYCDDTTKCYAKTHAKSAFMLTEKDISRLPFTEKNNPHYRCAAPMKLYSSKVLLNAAKIKYGTKRLMMVQENIKKQRALKRQQTKENAQSKRRDELVEKLGQRGLQLRSDSRLCEAYIAGGKGNPDAIVDVMHEMDFYYRHTDYRHFYQQSWREWKEYSGWCDPDVVSEEAKTLALHAFAQGRNDCPDFVPPSLRETIMFMQK